MKISSTRAFLQFWHLAEHPFRTHFSRHARLWLTNFKPRRYSDVFHIIGGPSRKDFRRSGFATVLYYSLPEAEPLATPVVKSSMSDPFIRSNFLQPKRPLGSIPLTSRPFAFKRAPNVFQFHSSAPDRADHEQDHTDSRALVKRKGAAIITITTPSSGAITLPATSERITQRLEAHHAKEELLEQSNNFLHRTWIRIRWSFLRQARPLNFEEMSAIFSWFVVGNIIWILVGTTTFCSLILYTLNTVFAQDYIAEKVGNFITKETGLTVVFENAIVPRWNTGVISFNKVFVSRRPGRGNHRVQKGSQAVAAANAALAAKENADMGEDDGNYTQYDLTIDSVSVTLSFSKWMNGTGIVQDMEVKGIRGIVDRRFVHWDPDDDATNYKNIYQFGDFEIESFKMEDALVTLYQPDAFRPFRVSIFNCDLPRLRKHWLFYDLLSANNMSGTYDNALFTIHPRQLENIDSTDPNGKPSPWKKVNRLRCDGVNIDHLNTGMEGPFGWIESGNVDMMADVMLPADEENLNLVQMVREIKESWKQSTAAMTTPKSEIIEEPNDELAVRQPQAKTLSSQLGPNNMTSNRYVILDFRVQLNNSKAAVPLFTDHLTYINNALIRPIVAYINSRETYIPISCQVVKKFEDFEGSWTMYDSRLMDDLSEAVYDAFAVNAMDDEARMMRMKKIGFWALQLAAQLVLLSLGAIA